MSNKQKRWLYAILILLNIPLGLATRWRRDLFPEVIQTYGGDTFSATCIFFGFRFLFPAWRLLKVSLISFIACVLDELQQLYQAPWAVKFRNITIVGVFLGHGFLWSDIVCYAVGILIALLIAAFLEKLFSNIKTKLKPV